MPDDKSKKNTAATEVKTQDSSQNDNKKTSKNGASGEESAGAIVIDLGLLEEDDEFEEFPAEDWAAQENDKDDEVNIWEDNWDDDNIEDDFSVQLRAELEAFKPAPKGNVGTGKPALMTS